MSGCRRRNAIGAIWWLAAIPPVGFGCARNPLGFRAGDGGQPVAPAHDAAAGRDVVTEPRGSGAPDAVQDLAGQDAPAGVDGLGGRDGVVVDACVPLVCRDPKCDPYCGRIGDGCGGTLDCGDNCPPGWTCAEGICRPAPAICMRIPCRGPSYSYCGRIGDGCGLSLDCATTCPMPGWQCVDSLCVAPRDVCTPIPSCQPWAGVRYCGDIGDGCGGVLFCGDCPAVLACEIHVCVDRSGVCPKVSCSPAGGGWYCGTIGDGCGGTQDCGTKCPDGSTCGQTRVNICGDGMLPDPPMVTQPVDPPPRPPPAPCIPPPPAPVLSH